MIVAMHQPHYLPWLGYFHKIDKCDCFVFLDNVQYEKGGFQNRNKIRTREGSSWLTVPVITKGLSTQKIKDILICNTLYWQKSHWGMIKVNYKDTPYFYEHTNFFSEVYTKTWEKLVDLNITIIKYILEYLGIKKDIFIASELDIKSNHTQRIVDICKRLNADTYLSGAGANTYLEEDKFKETKINLIYQEFIHPEYKQVFSPFIPNMSIIDLLFNHGKDSINILRRVK